MSSSERSRFVLDEGDVIVIDRPDSAEPSVQAFHLQGEHDQQSHAGGRAKGEFRGTAAARTQEIADRARQGLDPAEFDGPLMSRGIAITVDDDLKKRIDEQIGRGPHPDYPDEYNQHLEIGPDLAEQLLDFEGHQGMERTSGFGQSWTTEEEVAESVSPGPGQNLVVKVVGRPRQSDVLFQEVDNPGGPGRWVDAEGNTVDRGGRGADMLPGEMEVRVDGTSPIDIVDIQVRQGNHRWESVWGESDGYGAGADELYRAYPHLLDEMSVEVFHLQGQHDQQDHGNRAGAVAVLDGPLSGPEEMSAADAIETVIGIGEADRGVVDLTNLTLELNPYLFSGVPVDGRRTRGDMPQVPSAQIDAFHDHLEDEGVVFTKETIDPQTVKSTQTELDATKVGQMISQVRDGTYKAGREGHDPWISNDGYILDGHHRWATVALLSAAGEEHPPFDVFRVSLPIDELLILADQFNAERGIRAKTIEMARVALHLQGQHDQQSHAGDYQGGHRPNDVGPRIHDLLESEMTDGLDVYQNPQFFTGYPETELRETMDQLYRVMDDPEATVTIYRAAPSDADINAGDWVSLSETYAQTHMDSGNAGDDATILQMDVPAKEVRWAVDDLMEYGWFPDNADERIWSEADLAVRTLVDLAEFHLQGQHDQKDHAPGGRRSRDTSFEVPEGATVVEDDSWAEREGNQRLSGEGDCYPTANKMVMDKIGAADEDNWRAVHGVVSGQGELEGVRFGHAWVEETQRFPVPEGIPDEQRAAWERMSVTIVHDKSNGNDVSMPAEMYYNIGQIDKSTLQRYTPTETARNMARSMHHGPWEDEDL